MSGDIRESDWKLCRQLYPVVLGRFCESVLSQITHVASDATKTPRERYLAVYHLVREKDRTLAKALDDKRRSTALLQLSIIHSLGLLTEEEIARFSPDARDAFTWHKRI